MKPSAASTNAVSVSTSSQVSPTLFFFAEGFNRATASRWSGKRLERRAEPPGAESPWSTMSLSLPSGASGGELRGISCLRSREMSIGGAR